MNVEVLGGICVASLVSQFTWRFHPSQKILEASGFWGGDEVRATLQTSGYRFQDDAWNAMEIHSQREKLMLCRVFVEGIWRRFEATEDWVDIIKGKEEAGLAWIAANYLHGTFVSLLQLGICFNFTIQNGRFD